MFRFFSPSLMLAFAAAVPAAAQPGRPADPARRAAFTSERIGVTVTGTGPDVVLIPGLSSEPARLEQHDRGGARLSLPPDPRLGLRRPAGRRQCRRARC